MDYKLELVSVPVSDVDRAKAFYVDQAGFNADHDHKVSDELRFVQLTPPGSACSIAIGTGLGDAEPGSVQGLQLVVDDIEAARAELAGRGVEVSDVQDFPWGAFVFFSDPDGNGWAVQQIPQRPSPRRASLSAPPRAAARPARGSASALVSSSSTCSSAAMKANATCPSFEPSATTTVRPARAIRGGRSPHRPRYHGD